MNPLTGNVVIALIVNLCGTLRTFTTYSWEMFSIHHLLETWSVNLLILNYFYHLVPLCHWRDKSSIPWIGLSFLYLFILWLSVQKFFYHTRSFHWANHVNQNLPVSFCPLYLVTFSFYYNPCKCQKDLFVSKVLYRKIKKRWLHFWKHDGYIFLLTSYWP